jgi:hypothetical protein
MPSLTPGANANILSNFSSSLLSWMNGAEIPKNGPHTNVVTQYGCTINRDFSIESTRSNFKKGMQGHWIGDVKDGNVKIFIRGVTESWQNGIWVENQWVPASNVDKGKLWRLNINDWDFKMNLREWELGSSISVSKVTSPDTSVIGKTIAGLINEFHINPAPFMGTKIQGLLEKRTVQKKGSGIESVIKTIVQGIKDANLYVTLNRNNFTITDVIGAARYLIDENLQRGMGGGIYIRYHTSTSAVTRWRPNTKYIYVGKTIDFRDRFDNHPSVTTSYGNLTRNSQQLQSSVLCVMSQTDLPDFAYLVEQVFVCLFESYRSDVLISLDGTINAASLGGTLNATSGIEHIEAVQAAHYFKKVSERGVQGNPHS